MVLNTIYMSLKLSPINYTGVLATGRSL